jgi:hypothetical protein
VNRICFAKRRCLDFGAARAYICSKIMFTAVKNSDLIEIEQAKRLALSGINLDHLKESIRYARECYNVAKSELAEAERIQSWSTDVLGDCTQVVGTVTMSAEEYRNWMINQEHITALYGLPVFPYDIIYQMPAASYHVKDGRPKETRPKNPINSHQEKLLPQFATFFAKLKQLLLNLVKAIAHAKHRIHIGGKIDAFSLLQSLRNGETHSRNENSTVTRTSGFGSHGDFYVNGGIYSESGDSRRSLVCEGRNRSIKPRKRAGPAVGAVSHAF